MQQYYPVRSIMICAADHLHYLNNYSFTETEFRGDVIEDECLGDITEIDMPATWHLNWHKPRG